MTDPAQDAILRRLQWSETGITGYGPSGAFLWKIPRGTQEHAILNTYIISAFQEMKRRKEENANPQSHAGTSSSEVPPESGETRLDRDSGDLADASGVPAGS